MPDLDFDAETLDSDGFPPPSPLDDAMLAVIEKVESEHKTAMDSKRMIAGDKEQGVIQCASGNEMSTSESIYNKTYHPQQN